MLGLNSVLQVVHTSTLPHYKARAFMLFLEQKISWGKLSRSSRKLQKFSPVKFSPFMVPVNVDVCIIM